MVVVMGPMSHVEGECAVAVGHLDALPVQGPGGGVMRPVGEREMLNIIYRHRGW